MHHIERRQEQSTAEPTSSVKVAIVHTGTACSVERKFYVASLKWVLQAAVQYSQLQHWLFMTSQLHSYMHLLNSTTGEHQPSVAGRWPCRGMWWSQPSQTFRRLVAGPWMQQHESWHEPSWKS